jgi:hypothetical protein
MSQQTLLISGRVLDDRRRPLAGARVFVAAAPVAIQDIAALTGDDGTFSFGVPAPGSYRLQCIADGYRPRTLDIDMIHGRDATPEIRLDRA